MTTNTDTETTNAHTEDTELRTGRVVALYLRVSTDQQETERQRKALLRTAEERFPKNPIQEFTDDGVSAYKHSIDQRPGGSALCDLIETGTVAAVLADAQDRLSRGGDSEWIAFREMCRIFDTRIVIDGREMDDGMGSKMEGYLKALIAHQESAEKSHRVRSGVRSIREDGYWPYGKAPFGYDVSGEKRQRVLTPNKDAAYVVHAFEQFAQGDSLNRVTTLLCAESGRPLDRSGAKYLLSNPAYLGLIPEGVYKQGRGRKVGATHRGRHPALVSPELFERVQERLAGYAKASERQSDVHPFGPIARCGECGHALRYKPVNRPSGEPDIYFQCENKSCGKLRVPAEHFESAVVFSLAAVRFNLPRLLNDPNWAIAYPDTNEEAQLAAGLEQIRNEIDKVWARESDGTISEATAERLLGVLTERERHTEKALRAVEGNGRQMRTSLAELATELERIASEYGQSSEEEAGFLEFWNGAPVPERRRYLATILDRIELHGADPTRHTPEETPYNLALPHVELTFRAGINFKLPILMKRDRNVTPFLRLVGCGRKATEET